MLSQAIATTTVLLVVSLVTKLAFESGDASGDSGGGELVRQAVHFRTLATQDADAALRLQHLAMALAYIDAARALHRDETLERSSGRDVARLARHLERQVAEARKALARRKE